MIIPKEAVKKIDDVYKDLVKTDQKYMDIWFEYVFLSWQWWGCVIFSIFPWILWWKFRKKESTHRLLYGAFFIMLISMFLDAFGTELGYWDYRYEPLPFLPSFVPWDLSLLPIAFLVFVQIKPNSSPILKAFLYSFFCTFIGETIFEWLGFYHLIKWNHLYSFPIHFVIFLMGYFLVTSKNFEGLKHR
ncbi:CBO0543 family protein [Gracilibacillus sp. YIM 98692]|uniref:CBO0543 family protein n=1 Tax=Gracilibacillus sp. YIM 98692 TaxID=2663532 RepID=UPI0013D543D9|nr:CBO0543 family protein [Gracilibacillus sp. YIM 98692]